MRTTAFASPWPSSVRLPGPAWIWAPPRPFPVHLWLAKRASTTPPAGKDAGATGTAPTPHAGRDASATRTEPVRPLVPPASLPARPVGTPPTPPAGQAPTCSAGFQPARPGGAPPHPARASSAGRTGQPTGPAGKTPALPAETRRQDAGATSNGPASLPAHPINLAEKLSALLGIPPLPPAHPLVPPASLPARPVGALPTSPSPVPPAAASPSSQPAKVGFASLSGTPGAALAASRLDLELRLLFSRASAPLDEDRLAALHIELGQRAWSLTHTSGAPRPADPAWPTVPRPENALEKLRARLVADVDLGLSMVELSATRFSRPVRNVMLARQATYIGRCLRDLLADPEAGTFAEEWEQMMEGLRRRR